MAKYLNPPRTGWWPYTGYPEAVRIDGRVFRKAVLKQPYDGVVEQYREDVEKDSRHLKVYGNGTWSIDHIDEDNPDKGRAAQHFFNDHPLGALVMLGLFIAGGVVVVRAMARG